MLGAIPLTCFSLWDEMNHPLDAANQISTGSKERLEQVAQMWRSMLKALYLVR